ncbi:hypothetical protein BGZ65_010597, partial [Modicella reniformis]
MVITGTFLCSFATHKFKDAKYKKISLFLIGFYFYGGITYIAMVNLGVSSGAWLLVGSLSAAIILGSLRMIKPFKPAGAELLGPLTMHCAILWTLSWKPGGLFASKLAQGLMFGVLDVLGFAFVFIHGEQADQAAAGIGFPVLGAYVLGAGVDFFARTGFLQHADWFMNTKSDFDPTILVKTCVWWYFLITGLIGAWGYYGIKKQFKGGKGYQFYKKGSGYEYFTLLEVFWYNFRRLVCCGILNSD